MYQIDTWTLGVRSKHSSRLPKLLLKRGLVELVPRCYRPPRQKDT